MLRNREIELIAALVEGTLEDEAEARALIERSDEARAEYETQRITRETLAGVGTAQLSDHERSALHRDLWTAMQRPAPKPERAPWYFVWASAAAVLFVVVGLAAVFTRSGSETADQGVAAETTQAAEAAADAMPQADAMEEAAEGGASSETESDDGAIAEAPAASFAIPTAEFFSETATQVRLGNLDEALARGIGEADEEDRLTCLALAGLDDHEIIGETRDLEPGADTETTPSYLVAVPLNAVIGPETPVFFVAVDTCELVHTQE